MILLRGALAACPLLDLGMENISINSDIAHDIVHEIYKALEKLGAHPHLLAAVGGWGDVADDARTLAELRAWNEGAPWEPVPPILSVVK